MKNRRLSLLVTAGLLICSSPALASGIPGVAMGAGAAMPWDNILGMVAGALTGNTAKLMALIGIAIVAYMYITGEGHSSKLLKVGVGIALLVGAGSIVQRFFSTGSGAIF